MDAPEQVNRFKEFFEEHYLEVILENFRTRTNHIHVNFKVLSKFDINLANKLLDNYEETIKSAEMAVGEFELPKNMIRFNVRFVDLPKYQNLLIRNIRSRHIGKLYVFEGLVRQKSDVRPQVVNARFECPSCGNIITILQLDKQFREPSRCGCGRKGKFTLISKELIDAQSITLEEIPEQLKGGAQPKRIVTILKDDLVSEYTETKTNPGTKILIAGVIKEVPILTRGGGKSTTFDLIVEANNVTSLEDSYADIKISDDDLKEIKDLSKSPDVFHKLAKSIAPSTQGHNKIKEALVLQLLGGVKKNRGEGVTLRGDMHILLIGDPGAGKSMLLKRLSKVAPKARYVSGKGSSGAGLTAATVKDEFLGGWTLEAGALVLANKGFAMIDEMDKMDQEDTSAMHEAMEQQSVSISKANIQATLRSETTILAAANPKHGRFDSYEMLAKQINLPSTLINRFDLIFPLRDIPDKEKDKALAEFVLNLRRDDTELQAPINTDLLRKYISYARQNIRPRISDEALKEMSKYYVKMRNQSQDQNKRNKPIPISARQLEALARLAEASAKSRLSDIVTKDDARRSIALIEYCLLQIGMDPDTGKIDVDRFSSDTSASDRDKISIIKKIINNLAPNEKDTVLISDITDKAEKQSIAEDDTTRIIGKLKRAGDIFEQRRGYIQRL